MNETMRFRPLSELGLKDPEQPERLTHTLFPKKATVVDYNPDFPNILGLSIGEEFTLKGEGHSAVDVVMGRRTIFLPEPIEMDGEKYFLEVKGYGRNGQELYPEKHTEGDLYFGMFLDYAKKEFYMPKKCEELGIKNTQKGVALFTFSEEDFLENSLTGLEWTISAKLRFFDEDSRIHNAVKRMIPNFDSEKVWDVEEYLEEIAFKCRNNISQSYDKGGIEEVKRLAQDSGLEKELEGLLDPREKGYVVRAVKSPLRVGDLHDPKIVTEKNKEIARSMGLTVRKLFDHKYWHLSPNPGNWTQAGELVDFEDIIHYPTEFDEARRDMQMRKITSLKEYLLYTFGEGTLGYLAPEFSQGFYSSKEV